jgi:hypothetical protein
MHGYAWICSVMLVLLTALIAFVIWWLKYRLVRRTIRIIGGKGEGQVNTIVAYGWRSKTITLARPWDTPPDATSSYLIEEPDRK